MCISHLPLPPARQDVPFSERHPSLGRPVYVRLLDILLSKCELPEGFVSWDELDADEADEDSLTELREGAQVCVFSLLPRALLRGCISRRRREETPVLGRILRHFVHVAVCCELCLFWGLLKPRTGAVTKVVAWYLRRCLGRFRYKKRGRCVCMSRDCLIDFRTLLTLLGLQTGKMSKKGDGVRHRAIRSYPGCWSR